MYIDSVLCILFLMIWTASPSPGSPPPGSPPSTVQQLDATAFSALPEDAVATSVAVDHFDRDGVPDVVMGYRLADGSGALAFLRGRGSAIYPRHAGFAREPGDAALFGEARIYRVPVAVDWLVTGDFDAEGRVDVAIASRERAAIFWWPTSGDFELDALVEIPLGGLRPR